jgi:diguanylate cyclase (GGDEF)-like protein
MVRRIWHRIRYHLWSVEDRMELRHQVAIATSILCFVLVTTIAVGAALVGRHEATNAAGDRLNGIADTLSHRIDQALSTRLGLVAHVAGLVSFGDSWTGQQRELRRILANSRDALPDTVWLGFATPDGIIRAAAGGAFEGQSVAHHSWFRRGLSGAAIVDSATESARGDPGFADTSIQRFVEIGMPVRDEAGNLVGVLGLYLSRLWADRLRDATVADVDASQDIRVALLERDGTVALGHRESNLQFDRQELSAMLGAGSGLLAPNRAGDFLTAFAVTDGDTGGSRPSWIVVARQPRAVALQAADRVLATIVALGVMVGIAGIFGAMGIAARVSAPFQKLADKAGTIGRDSNDTFPRVRGSFEATRLSAALRALVLRLSTAEKTTAEAEGRAADAARELNRDIVRLRNLADADTLTELLNRRAFMELGSAAVEEYRRYNADFAVLMIDIDRFKSVNDSFGHSTGDGVIRSVARSITGLLRPSDRAARFGGEEFVALLRHVSEAEAEEIAQRLRRRVASTPITVGENDLFVTISIGVASCGPSDRDLETLIERADIALYAAKRGGRNSVAVAEAVPDRKIA